MMNKTSVKILLGAGTALACSIAQAADIKVGITMGTSGPSASIGIPMSESIKLFPTKIGEHNVEYVLLDDGGDIAKAVSNARKLIYEENVDILFGTTSTAGSFAQIDVAAEASTPMMVNVPSTALVAPLDDKKRWAFQVVLSDRVMSRRILSHMRDNGVKTVGYLGWADSYGDGYWNQISAAAAEFGIEIIGKESFTRTDTTVAAQALKLAAAAPDAIMIVAAGSGAVLPQQTLVERGYRGKFYQTQGALVNAYLDLGGAAVEGTYIVGAPFIVLSELPKDHPVVGYADIFVKDFTATYGRTPHFGSAVSRDMMLVFEDAADRAIRSSAPGTPGFRSALRDEIERSDGVLLSGGMNRITTEDHNGFADDAPAVILVKDSKFTLAP